MSIWKDKLIKIIRKEKESLKKYGFVNANIL